MRITKLAGSLVLSALALSVFAFAPVMAAPNMPAASGTSTKSTLRDTRMERIVSRSNQEIDRRTAMLATLSGRVQLMKRLSDAEKATIVSEVQAQINALNSLKTKIGGETDIAALRADAQMIVKSYRIFALIIPQSHIMIAVDRIGSIADALSAVGTKLQTRIASEQAAGKDVTAAQAALNDMTAKILIVKELAQEAQNTAAPLVPDQGDQVKFKANKDALHLAQSKIQEAHLNLAAARIDAHTVMQALRVDGDNGTTATSTSAAERNN